MMEINELIPVEYSERVIELAKNIELFTSTVTIEPTYYGLNKDFNTCIQFDDVYEAIEANESGKFNILFNLHDFKNGRRKEYALENINGFFIDIDIKHGVVTNPNELSERLNRLPIKPHYIVGTAGGWHLYYLTEKIPYSENRKLVINVQNYITNKLDGDKGFTYVTAMMKVPFLHDIHKDKDIRLGLDRRNSHRYTLSEISDIFTNLDDFLMLEIEEKNLLPTAAKIEKLEQVNDLDIDDVIPMLFAYMNDRGYLHDYTYEGGFISKSGVRLPQLAVDIKRNRLHDFSNTKEDFSGKVSYFVSRFIKHVISEGSKGLLGSEKYKNVNENIVRTTFLRDIYGLVSSRGKSIVIPKSTMMSYHQDIIVPSLDVRYEMKNGPMRERFDELLSTPGGDVVQIAELLMSLRKNESGELNLVERGRLQNALILTADSSVRNVTRTWMQLMDYCGRRGTTNIPMIKIKDLFADYFDKKTFNNKKFIIDLIYDIQTLSVLKKYVKDRNNIIQSTPLLRFTSNQDDLSVSIEMFPDMDKSLIQNRIYYFLPSGFIEVQTNNPAFYDFSFKLHNELFILKRSEFSKKDIIIWLRLNEQSKDWKRWADKNIELFISKLDKKVTYIYDKKAEKFIFSK